MPFLNASVEAVQRNLRAFAIYAAISVGAYLLNLAWTLYEGAQGVKEVSPGDIAVMVVICALTAVGQTISFARLGKDIDRPLWKSSGDWEALRRYYTLWLVLCLLPSVLVVLMGRESAGLDAMALILFAVVAAIGVPVCACFMFAGNVEVRERMSTLTPLITQFPRTLLLSGIGFFCLVLFFMQSHISANDPTSVVACFSGLALQLVFVYCDCVVFAGAWIICKTHRDTEHDIDIEF